MADIALGIGDPELPELPDAMVFQCPTCERAHLLIHSEVARSHGLYGTCGPNGFDPDSTWCYGELAPVPNQEPLLAAFALGGSPAVFQLMGLGPGGVKEKAR